MKRLIILLALIAAAVSLVAPAASGIAAVANTSAVPAPLVGKWTRTVTAADVKRVGATYPVHAGMVCTLTIKKDGVFNASVICTGGQKGGFVGTVEVAGPNRVHIKLSDPYPDVYSWHVSERRLTFTKVKDPFANRVAVFSGVWHRK
jgi:hypothetical protein